MESWVQSWRPRTNAFPIFPLHLSKVLRLPRKSEVRSYEVLRLSRKIIFPKLKIWCSKMQPLSGNQRPDLITSLMNMSLVLRLPGKMYLCRSSSNVPRLPSLLEMLQNPHVLLSHLPSGFRTRRFSEHTFRPSGATNIGKTQCFATLLPFHAPGSSFFWGFLFFDLLSSSLLFSDSSDLCFSSVHIVGSLTSKLPLDKHT